MDKLAWPSHATPGESQTHLQAKLRLANIDAKRAIGPFPNVDVELSEAGNWGKWHLVR